MYESSEVKLLILISNQMFGKLKLMESREELVTFPINCSSLILSLTLTLVTLVDLFIHFRH